LHEWMAEKSISVMKTEVSTGSDMKHSGHYLTAQDKLFMAEYETLIDYDISLDASQKQRREALGK
jgi:hypothetical protein